MAKSADQTQQVLNDALDSASGEATLLLARAEKNENDGRAIIALLRGQASALQLLDGRLKNIEGAALALKRRNSRETAILVALVVIVAFGLGFAILSP